MGFQVLAVWLLCHLPRLQLPEVQVTTGPGIFLHSLIKLDDVKILTPCINRLSLLKVPCGSVEEIRIYTYIRM